MNELPTLAEVESALDSKDIDTATDLVKRFFDHTIRCGPQSEDRAWIALRLAVLWYNDQEAVPATVWTHRALIEGPRADGFALLGEIARLEEDWPLAARWFEIARTTLCPARCIRGVMDALNERVEEHRRDLLQRRVEYGLPSDHLFLMMCDTTRKDITDMALKSLRCDDYSPPCYLITDSEGEGQAKTFFRCLREAAKREDGYVTIFENDIRTARNTMTYIESTVFPQDAAMVSWFHKLAPAQSLRGPFWLVESAQTFSCNQAITMPLETVRALLDSKELQAWSEPHGADMLIGKVMPDAKVAYHFPNLVQHVGGHHSLVGNDGARTSPTFVGEYVDALSLREI